MVVSFSVHKNLLCFWSWVDKNLLSELTLSLCKWAHMPNLDQVEIPHSEHHDQKKNYRARSLKKKKPYSALKLDVL